ncbi:Parvulin-like peptidyl-prolyl isomerase [Rickettsia prowazekii str. Cairo 3]|nr:hypothetical protein H374_2230 [Rickettsia prowazekii str. NMRC Madrid E]EOB09392.1 Parvulin-like peptidyl-prolyl isomerase [Rickettsia prowazekii str. Cairo 3]
MKFVEIVGSLKPFSSKIMFKVIVNNDQRFVITLFVDDITLELKR